MDLRIAPKSLQQQTVERLRSAILSGMFKQGQRLVETDLCEKLGISRPSLREALRSLEAERLIQIVPNRGPIVPIMTWEKAQQIYDVRLLIEGEAAALAASNISDDALNGLRTALKDFAKAQKTDDAAARLKTTTRFYEIIFHSSGNTIIEEIARGLLARINFLRQQSMSNAGRGRHSFREMKTIFNAIEDRNPDAARDAAREHVKLAREAAKRAFTQVRDEHDGNG
jgi:DNA-binding GntR family transcriptional regulator